MRLRGQVDSNQKEIVEALRKAGRTVVCCYQVGAGFPDLVVGYQGKNFLLEVKLEKGKLTPPQEKFVNEWRGQIAIVRSAEDAIKVTA